MIKLILLISIISFGYKTYKAKSTNFDKSSDNDKIEYSVNHNVEANKNSKIKNAKKEFEDKKKTIEENIKDLGDKEVSLNDIRKGLKTADGYFEKYRNFKQSIRDKLRKIYEKFIGK